MFASSKLLHCFSKCVWSCDMTSEPCVFTCLQWLETRPNRQVCPVCKAGISRDKVIPLYGRGSTGQQDPRYSILQWYLCCRAYKYDHETVESFIKFQIKREKCDLTCDIHTHRYIIKSEWMFLCDFRERTPPRPQGQRPEPENRGVSVFHTVSSIISI